VNIRNFESNQIVTSAFNSIRNKHNYSKYKGVQENDVSVEMCVCTVLLLTMVQVLYLLEVGPLWPTKYWNSFNRNHNRAVP